MSDTILLTGASAGLGLRTAGELAAAGHHVILACRNPERAAAAVATITAASPQAELSVVTLDTASVESVRAASTYLAQTFPQGLSAVVCNAGIQITTGVQTSVDGYETTFATNHLGHFQLVTDLLKSTLHAGSRIINVASEVHQGPSKSMGFPAPRWADPLELADPTGQRGGGKYGRIRYATSKLANIYFTYELARRLDGTGITASAFDPGLMPETGLARDYPSVVRRGYQLMTPILTKLPGAATAARSAADLAWLTASPETAGITGKYYSGRREHPSSRESYDTDRGLRLWEASEELVTKAAG
ncbi:SDR family NAD(P)-dependent oxidoreductase [Nocardia salmonicida]|uniref:SDR family NAD(P)-dependent oxidoreductase n=1 Tax=Nocardia TaxID=1817 RepID=UPI00265B334D|nr:SDR family NAD(P)-dependent oxidoreductase [Nocardia sp. PE-7]WKG11796.1 SDR family NAD(P)-dependent oxidoreductase [Nocardia sp. PE-7]